VHQAFGDDEMFRERLVRWTTLLEFRPSEGPLTFLAKAIRHHATFSLGKDWNSSSEQRDFSDRFTVQRAAVEAQGRVPLAR